MHKIKEAAIFFDRDGVLIDAPLINKKPTSVLTVKDIKLCNLLPLWNRILCQNNQNAKLRKIVRQQDLYALMRRRPELFPITSYVQQMNLSLADQRRYSNLWYRQFGTSQALPVNDVWGGFYVVGSEVPYTN